MKQITGNIFVETQVRGCNFGYVTTSDGIVMIDSPQLPSTAIQLQAELKPKGPLRYIINTEPHGDHWTGNGFFDAPVIAHEGVRSRILDTDMEQHKARVGSYGPEEPALLEGYAPNLPVVTFKNGMTLHVGDHTFEMIHMPGHTLYQAAILIKEEGVVFTSDNIFHKVQTWLQEANPDLWLVALESLRRLDEQVFVPGHGELCDKGYLDEQGEFIQEWKDYVKDAINRGMTAVLEGYAPNLPVVTFKNGMTLHVGDHTFEMIHMPGHTLSQAAILIKEEGVVFTSDNIFHKVQTWLQEANPDLWLVALESLRRLDEQVFVPGHGELCDKGYLDEQGEFIQEWKDYVKDAIDRGMTKDESVANLTKMTDRYPMDVGQDGMAPGVMKMNAANLYNYLTGTTA